MSEALTRIPTTEVAIEEQYYTSQFQQTGLLVVEVAQQQGLRPDLRGFFGIYPLGWTIKKEVSDEGRTAEGWQTTDARMLNATVLKRDGLLYYGSVPLAGTHGLIRSEEARALAKLKLPYTLEPLKIENEVQYDLNIQLLTDFAVSQELHIS